jgi:2-phosphoglycerate kinase
MNYHNFFPQIEKKIGRNRKNKIIIITGTPGVGKSTVAKILCQKINKSVYISLDSIRNFVKNGYENPAKLKWNTSTIKQGKLARKSASYISKLYADNGFTIIIDDIVYGEYLDFWINTLKFYNLKIFVLNHDTKKILKRNKNRKIGTLNEKVIINLKKEFDKIPQKINISFIKNTTIDTTIDKIFKFLEID